VWIRSLRQIQTDCMRLQILLRSKRSFTGLSQGKSITIAKEGFLVPCSFRSELFRNLLGYAHWWMTSGRDM